MRRVAARNLGEVLAASHLPALDGVRAIAVFVVIASHSPFGIVHGDLGVSAFFVLSGFLITWLLLREREASGTVSLRRFYFRRTLRIFPAYYCFLLLSVGIDSWRDDVWSPGLLAAAFLYAMNYYNAAFGHPATSVAHAWSLAVEEQFYLLWPWLFRALLRRGTRPLTLGLITICTAILLWRCVLYLHFGVGTAYVYNAFDTRFDNIAIGCLVAVGVREPRFRSGAALLARSPFLPCVTLVLLGLSRAATPEPYHYGPGFTVDALLLAILLVQLLQLSGTWMWSWLDHPVVRYLGSLSYPMYLYHAWGLGLGRQVIALPATGRFLLGVLCTIALASASYHIVERPFLRLKERFEPRKRGTSPVS